MLASRPMPSYRPPHKCRKQKLFWDRSFRPLLESCITCSFLSRALLYRRRAGLLIAEGLPSSSRFIINLIRQDSHGHQSAARARRVACRRTWNQCIRTANENLIRVCTSRKQLPAATSTNDSRTTPLPHPECLHQPDLISSRTRTSFPNPPLLQSQPWSLPHARFVQDRAGRCTPALLSSSYHPPLRTYPCFRAIGHSYRSVHHLPSQIVWCLSFSTESLVFHNMRAFISYQDGDQ